MIGFFVANKLNRSEVDGMRAELTRLRAGSSSQAKQASSGRGDEAAVSSLTDDEIRNAIATADARPKDSYLQRNLGLALYRYSTRTPNAFYLEDVVRLLKRAFSSNGKDHEIIAALANALFDIGRSSDAARLNESRAYYLKALEIKPDDVNARTDLGLTYYLQKPSDPQRAIIEYRRSLAIEPRHELTLQNLATALISTGQRDEAAKLIDELGGLNPSNPALPDLRAQLSQSKVINQE
jgi:tetratricopeptide (TPR) repeat protein